MAENHLQGITSSATLGKHPLHPILIPFPISFLTAALATDLAYWWVQDPFWARMSFWLIGAGFLTGALAALLGFIDFLTIKRARQHFAGWIHFLGNVAVLGLSFINYIIRRGGNAETAIWPWGLVVSAIVALLLVITGWYGGELTYYHKIGVVEREKTLSEK